MEKKATKMKVKKGDRGSILWMCPNLHASLSITENSKGILQEATTFELNLSLDYYTKLADRLNFKT